MSVPRPAHAAPSRIALDGRWCRLEPLAPCHAPSLFAAARDDGERFRYLFTEAPVSEAELIARIERAAAADDPLPFGVIDKASGRCEGQQSFMRIEVAHGVIEIGGIYWGPAMARTRIATEALFLFARHAFDDLGYRRFEWKCNALNEPSRRAALRFGFSFEGIFRQHMIVKNQNRDTAWFSILDGEWPKLRAEYQRWLAPENFGPGGAQQTPLRFA